MKALFAHDHRFIPADGSIWTESQFDATLWPRYLKHFQDLTVVARKGAVPKGKTLAQMELASAPGVAFVFLPNLSNAKGLTFARPSAARKMRDLVAGHDAVIARLPSEIGLLAIAAARASGKPWAVEVVGCPWDGMWHYGSLAGRVYAPLAWFRLRQALRKADNAIYVTRSFLQKRYPTCARNSAAASNVVLRSVSEKVLEARMTRIHDLASRTEDRALRLGLIGSLHGQHKGIQTVLAALAMSRDALPPLSVHILGNGDPTRWQQEAERAGVADLVHFEGTLPAGDAVLHWLDDIDIYLQPSLQEGLPRAVIEAMSRGCPVLASRVAGIPELLPPDDLIPPGDAGELVELLRKRVSDLTWMSDRAQRNWTEAQAYRADVLDKRREEFWKKFRDTCDD